MLVLINWLTTLFGQIYCKQSINYALNVHSKKAVIRVEVSS